MADIIRVQKVFTPALWTTLAASPATIVPAQGLGKVIMPVSYAFSTLATGHTPYAAGSSVTFLMNGFGWMFGGAAAANFTNALDRVCPPQAISATARPATDVENMPLILKASGAEFTNGAGTNVILEMLYWVANIR